MTNNDSEHFWPQVQDFLESHLNQLGEEVASLQHGVQVKDEKCSSHSGDLSLFQVFGKKFPVSMKPFCLNTHLSSQELRCLARRSLRLLADSFYRSHYNSKDQNEKGLDRTVRI